MSNYSNMWRKSDLFGWHVYVVAERGGNHCKIGTALTPAYRIAGLQNGNPRRLDVVAVFHFHGRTDALRTEAAALTAFGAARLPGRDWVECAPSTAVAAVEDAATALGVRFAKVET